MTTPKETKKKPKKEVATKGKTKIKVLPKKKEIKKIPEKEIVEEKKETAGIKAETGELVEEAKKRDRYFEDVGRRKTSIARVRLFTKAGEFMVNGKLYNSYFPTFELQKIVEDALQKMKLSGRFRVSIKVFGGGIHSQAEAVRHGLARCLVKFNPDFRKRLKRAGYLKRDPRMKERKKFGLKKARKAPQWAKR